MILILYTRILNALVYMKVCFAARLSFVQIKAER